MRQVLIAAVAAVYLSPLPVSADTWDENVRRLCTSTQQKDCWIKSGAIICDQDQLNCITLSDHTPAKVIREQGARWYVETPSGFGWVSGRMMMLDGSAMR